ncbi:MAG: glycosyltransferase [Polyangiaceae bacterium]
METASQAMSALAALDIAIYVGSMTLFLTALRKSRRAPRRPLDRAAAVTIFKPLAGNDDELAANLESFAALDYPCFEILLGVASTEDPAYVVARDFVRRNKHVRARVVLTDRNAAQNPKVAQLLELSRQARGELFVISDSNVRVPKDYLWSLLSEISRPGVGLVTSVFAGSGETTLGAALENLQLASVVAPAVVLSTMLTNRPFTIGKSMAMWKRDLAEIGGFSAVGDVLAEDHVLGDRFKAAGYSLRTSFGMIQNRNVDCSTRRTLERHARWAKIRRSLSPHAFLLEPLGSPVVIAFLLFLLSPSRTLFFCVAASAALQSIFAFASVRILRGKSLAIRYAPLEVARAFAIFGCWLWALLSDRVVWRGNPFRILPGSRIVPASPRLFARRRSLRLASK